VKHHILRPGEGRDYDWSNDHIYVKAASGLSDGRVTLVEDVLKPGFLLARHSHERTTEVFYVLDGVVEFRFDDETVAVEPGATVTVPPGVAHEVSCEAGGRLLTIFTPGGFEDYLAEMAAMSPEQSEDEGLLRELSRKYDAG